MNTKKHALFAVSYEASVYALYLFGVTLCLWGSLYLLGDIVSRAMTYFKKRQELQ